MKRPSAKTRVVLHNHPQQPHGCLRGLANYAEAISQTPVARAFPSLSAYERWSMRQPVKIDVGEGPSAPGCIPAQRSRLWPQDGLNCWEATAHFVGVALAQGAPLDIHVYDRSFGPVRHVYPAVRGLGDTRPPVPVLLQPSLPRPRAQEWWSDVLGGVHLVGNAALAIFGLGGVGRMVEKAEGDALPEWARVHDGKVFTPPLVTEAPPSNYTRGRAPLPPEDPAAAAPLVLFRSADEYARRMPVFQESHP